MPRAYGRSLRVARTRDADALWMCHSLGLHTGVFVFCGKGGEDGRCLCLFWTEVITLVDGCWELFTRSRDYKIYQRTNKELQSHSAAAGGECPASNEGTLISFRSGHFLLYTPQPRCNTQYAIWRTIHERTGMTTGKDSGLLYVWERYRATSF